MNCPDPICRIIPCAPQDDLPSYYGQYSLQSGVTYDNGEIVVPAPGGGTYTVPPGTIVINLPPGSTSVTYQGCQSTVSLPIPSGSTPSAIQDIVNQVMMQVAQQLAICNAPINPHSGGPFPPITFSNVGVGVNCPGGLAMQQIAPLPGIVTMSGDSLFLDAGNFSSSVSVDAANADAIAFLTSLIGVKVQCGYWNTAQSFTCPDHSVQTVPARTYFSTVSQVDADALALAAAEAECSSPPNWSDLLWTVTFRNPSSGQTVGFSLDPGTGNPQVASVSVTGHTFNGEWKLNGVLNYNGPSVNCLLSQIQLDPVGQITTQIFYEIRQGADVIANGFLPFIAGSGTETFPFTIPDTGGISKPITIDIQSFDLISGAADSATVSIGVSNV